MDKNIWLNLKSIKDSKKNISELDEAKSTISYITIAGTGVGLLVTIVICILAFFLKIRKSQKRDQGKFTKYVIDDVDETAT